ncbi:Beta-N-acetylhexosaminidase [Microbacterium lemovicicum]|uniref:beta-N-acetylhexosaminidase n=1 Tax=Microbacterium lemovicicum TaxID=1072463 RepID=A0A3S9W7S6_9MICO|nr:family 20 glycosylhydrolase [Microbacterium lemovicicum]AZS36054.1 Beta-N-acetylhexosaminidase [Microbacterium lemovicicum]
MTPLPLVPLPASVALHAAAAPFRLVAGEPVAGEADAAATWTRIVAEVTGSSAPEPASAGHPAPRIAFRLAHGGPPESSRIVVDAASVDVSAPDAAGLFYAAHTLGQLLRPDTDEDPERGAGTGTDTERDAGGLTLPPGVIEDAPRFGYRGVMLDVARHFAPVETVRAYIDRAAALKFNALHLHLTDDQGWRLQLRSRPLLTERASGTAVGGDAGGFYSTADFRDIVAYAASRHMTVVPEIDVPGHTHAVGLAYPELVEAPVLTDEIRAQGGVMPESGVPYEGIGVGFSSLRIGDEAVYDFLADVFGEIAGLTPGPYLHVGGDECHGTDPEDFAVFMARATRIVADLGRTPIAWHEAGSATIDDSTVGQYWGFTEPIDGADAAARAFVANGAQVILSPADAAYLDMKYDEGTALGLTWADGPTSVERAYSWEPVDVVDGIGEADILGVEAPLWTETVRSLDDIDTLAFPRIAAIAEIAWSPAAGRDWDSFRARVAGLGPLWDARGIAFFRSPEIAWASR